MSIFSGPSLIGWGAAAGIFALTWLEVTPLAKRGTQCSTFFMAIQFDL